MKYKIIEVLRTFSQKEIKKFQRFLESPYFNDSPKIRRLYSILIKYHPEYDSYNLNEEHIHKELNPQLAFNKSTLNSLFFEISSLADKFLAVENFLENEFMYDDLLRTELQKKKLPKYLI